MAEVAGEWKWLENGSSWRMKVAGDGKALEKELGPLYPPSSRS
jgi:hypothetical protein